MSSGWREWSRGQWLARVVVLLGPVVSLLARWPTDPPQAWLVVLVAALATGWAFVPDSVVGAVVLLLVGFSWTTGAGGGPPVGALVAAAAMLAAHVAALLASYGPDTLPLSPAVVRLWVRRGLLVLPVVPAVWLVARVVRELPGSETVWLLGMAVALSVTVVACVVTQTAAVRADD